MPDQDYPRPSAISAVLIPFFRRLAKGSVLTIDTTLHRLCVNGARKMDRNWRFKILLTRAANRPASEYVHFAGHLLPRALERVEDSLPAEMQPPEHLIDLPWIG